MNFGIKGFPIVPLGNPTTNWLSVVENNKHNDKRIYFFALGCHAIQNLKVVDYILGIRGIQENGPDSSREMTPPHLAISHGNIENRPSIILV